MDGFTLTELAFPVAPTDLDGFTIQGFQWVGGPEPVTVQTLRICIAAADNSRVAVPAVVESC